MVFDGRRLAFSLKDIALDSNHPHLKLLIMIETYSIQLPEDDGNVAVSKRPPREFKIRIRKSGQLFTREILQFLKNKPHDESTRFTGNFSSLLSPVLPCLSID